MTDSNSHLQLEDVWEQLLSRQPDLIRLAFNSLPPAQQTIVLVHLKRMAFIAGWHSEQRISAQEALQTLDFNRPKSGND